MSELARESTDRIIASLDSDRREAKLLLERVWPALDRGADEEKRLDACAAMDDLERLLA